MKAKLYKAGILITTLMLTGCGRSTNYDVTSTELATEDITEEEYSIDNSYGFNDAMYETDSQTSEAVSNDTISEDATSDTSTAIEEEKLVYTANLTIQTLEYEKSITGIKQLAQKYNAIISQEDETDSYYDWYYSDSDRGSSTRYDYICLRVPSKSYEDFLDEVGSVGTVTAKSQSVENITSDYYDVATQIASLKKQEERLLEMYDECETIEDMIAVEARLNEVQTDLSSYQTKLNRMDKDVAYSYVNINVEEVVEISRTSAPTKTNTFKDRLINTLVYTKEATLQGLEDLLFGIIEHYILIIIIIVIYVVFRKRIKALLKTKFGKKEDEKKEKSKEEDSKK